MTPEVANMMTLAVSTFFTNPPIKFEPPNCGSSPGKLNDEVAQMQIRKDAAAAERLLADEYLFIQGDGQVSSKAQNVEILRSADFECQALTTDDVQVRIYGNTALIIGRAHFKATYKGRDVSGEFWYTDVWVRRAGRWQNVASQATRLPTTKS
jgi:hypothetical protein